MKEETIIKTGAYVYCVNVTPNVEHFDLVDGESVLKYKNYITITFDVKGENIITPQEVRTFYSETFDVKMTVEEWLDWQANNILDFIYAGKNDIAGYVPQQ
jgi:hypothetical protein